MVRPVPLPEALAGGWVQVPSLSGAERIRLPKGSKDGDVLRMEGHGLLGEDGHRGDQFVELAVEMPEGMSEAQLRQLKAALETDDTRFPESRAFEKKITSRGEES